jgi:hypothetical protein
VKRDGDGGESLLETMFAVVMLGLLVVTAVMAFTSVINEAIQYRMLASINVVLHNDVSEATTQLQNQANPLYATCATPATYSPSGTNAVRFTKQMAGYSSTITAVTYWDGNSFVATCPPIVGEPQPQQITVRVTSADGVMSDSSQFTVDNPYSSSQYPPDLAIGQLAFVQQPTTIYSLQTFSPSVQVAVEDANGNVLTSDWSNVTMTVTPIARTNGGSLVACSGTENQGVFTFPTCTLDGGGQYELVAADQGITATSIMFNAIAQLDPPVVTAAAGSESQLGAVTINYTPSDNAPSDQAYTGYACLDPQLDSNCTLVTPFASGGTIEGLQSGQVYYVVVVATASQDYLDAVSLITNPVAATMQDQTPVITNVTGAGGLNVMFTDATIAPSPTYSVTACTDQAISQNCVTVPSFTSGSTITGVTLGAGYYITVAVVSQPGWLGASSAPYGPTTVAPATVPGTPSGATAVAAQAQVTVSWLAPATSGGSPITSYTVTSSPGGFTCTTAALTCVVTGLTNGTSYTFTVTATNTVGTGPASAPSAPVTPAATAPGAPTGITGVAGNTQVTVSWLAPASNGGSPITIYTVTSSPGGFTCTTATLTCVVTGLTNGTSYTFIVTATNTVGTSPASAPSTTVLLAATIPGAPMSVTGAPGNSKIAVSWLAPASNGGSPITSYTVTSSPGGFTCTAATLTCVVTGLTNGSSYTFTVTAINAVGPSPTSSPSPSVTPATVPGAPMSVTGAPGNSQIALSWLAPASNGGSPITSYTVTSSPGGFTCTAATLTCVVPGLTNGTSYTFTVTAINAVGPSPTSLSSPSVTPATVPGVPTGLSATGSTSSLSAILNWSAPSSNGSSITGYAIEYSQSSSTGPWTSATANTGSTGTSFTLTLSSSTTFYWQVAAINTLGQSTWSSADPVTWSVTGSYAIYGYVTVPIYGFVTVPVYGYVQVYEQTGTAPVYGYTCPGGWNGPSGSTCWRYMVNPPYSYLTTGASYGIVGYTPVYGYVQVYEQTGTTQVYEQTGTTQVYEQTGTGYYYGWVG